MRASHLLKSVPWFALALLALGAAPARAQSGQGPNVNFSFPLDG